MAEAEEPPLNNFYATLFKAIRQCFDEETFCDVRLYANDDSNKSNKPSLKCIPCHALVLCSVAPAFKNVIRELCQNGSQKFENNFVLFLPSYSLPVTKQIFSYQT